jgi:F-type H+-transporting ATPase subunit delta
MATTHDNVLEAGSVRSRIARVYAEAALAAALSKGEDPEALGQELTRFVDEVLAANPTVAAFLTSPAVGKTAKSAALDAALQGRCSDLFRGLCMVLLRNGRMDLLRGVAAAYSQLLDERAGRIPVRVVTAVELTEAQRQSLKQTLAEVLQHEPVLKVRVDPSLLGGLLVQVGDRVIDTSVRTRLETLRTLMLNKGSSYVLQQV